jgi:hypothetical protein
VRFSKWKFRFAEAQLSRKELENQTNPNHFLKNYEPSQPLSLTSKKEKGFS